MAAMVLAAWTTISLTWWAVAAALVALGPRSTTRHTPPDARRISVFKCLPATSDPQERCRLERNLETFVAELDGNSELLLGVHEQDAPCWRTWVARMRRHHPDAHLALVVEAAPERLSANPKISWMQLLAGHATGALWLWSDADMQAPPGTLHALRSDLAAGRQNDAGMVTSPYLVRRVGRLPALLDALYVNLEHHPGAVLLDRLNRIRFGFGAGMLFEASAFRHHVGWESLGQHLADDFHLGRLLAPVRLGSTVLTTTAASDRWLGAILHYHRWRKTVRWSAPGGFAGELLILPAVGWLCALAIDPARPVFWSGLAAVMLMDSVAALVICRLAACRLSLRHLPGLPAWSLLRPLVWLACWLPLPVVWRGRTWWTPHRSTSPRPARA